MIGTEQAPGRRPAQGAIIAGIATPPGRGGVGIVRMSGPGADRVAKRFFRASSPGFVDFKPRCLHHGTVLDASGQALDEGLVVFMPGPNSFTGEDVVEFQMHGSPVLLDALMRALTSPGPESVAPAEVREAAPGEFTRRAFLNGRIDLAQAEAVAEIVNAESLAAARIAENTLRGAVSGRVSALSETLKEARLGLMLAVDFPEDEVETLDETGVRAALLAVRAGIAALIEAGDNLDPLIRGASVVLAGAPNVGKSSLFNALTGLDRALVAEVPGTTRDYIEAPLHLGRARLTLVDTAGLREGGCAIERAGRDLARSRIAGADLVLLVLDAADSNAPAPNTLGACLEDAANVLYVLNKIDLAAQDAQTLPSGLAALRVSARTGEGVAALKDRIAAMLFRETPNASDATGPNRRQRAALAEALFEVDAALDDLGHGAPADLLAARLDFAALRLGTVLGHDAPDDLLDAIFSRFCIGK